LKKYWKYAENSPETKKHEIEVMQKLEKENLDFAV